MHLYPHGACLTEIGCTRACRSSIRAKYTRYAAKHELYPFGLWTYIHILLYLCHGYLAHLCSQRLLDGKQSLKLNSMDVGLSFRLCRNFTNALQLPLQGVLLRLCRLAQDSTPHKIAADRVMSSWFESNSRIPTQAFIPRNARLSAWEGGHPHRCFSKSECAK